MRVTSSDCLPSRRTMSIGSNFSPCSGAVGVVERPSMLITRALTGPYSVLHLSSTQRECRCEDVPGGHREGAREGSIHRVRREVVPTRGHPEGGAQRGTPRGGAQSGTPRGRSSERVSQRGEPREGPTTAPSLSLPSRRPRECQSLPPTSV